MVIRSVMDKEFKRYGKVVDGYNVDELMSEVAKNAPIPLDAVIYEPSIDALEKLDIAQQFKDNFFGGLPIQIGYCCGNNSKLNCVEYHKSSEINIGTKDFILLVGLVCDIEDNKYETAKIEAFHCPANIAVELYATTLHYAPCTAKNNQAFQTVVVLPKDTNTDKPEISIINDEDKLLFAKNKWLIAHKETDEAKNGAVAGLIGDNIEISF